MTSKPAPDQPRSPLTRERVLQQAARIADTGGLAALTMRALAQAMSVQPMSLYHHVSNKDDILDGLIDLVFSEVDVPDGAPGDWRAAMERRAHDMRAALTRHPWAVGLMETRTSPGTANLRHHNATLGVLRRAGFSLAAAGHAYALLDSYVYGFALQEAGLPVGRPDSDPEVVEAMARSFSPDDLPYLAEMAMDRAMQPGYSFGAEFDVGLDIILDGLARLLKQSASDC
ncbi:TetR/AcrR family transcriptional regulator [Arthrobacter gengyunqii]|uniref:TetR/AcrR family transcriptional regulator n=1 Tax=Arthrobacter gengyunqii TaxID=2886940 RepID=A0A9X1M5P6_9MICC|nr:TetR/AcrR family transcriptional regulator C-terminal domain-containing protein [Arthrobacter gengyunqii]MCC3271057.1 TetR/AcrR family transcriptional regulator [Arthrobacter gengyunqii]UOY96773.1 TetR/AcrR family transcriptional regulator [Arthrobacter gengyunqii]